LEEFTIADFKFVEMPQVIILPFGELDLLGELGAEVGTTRRSSLQT